MESDGAGALRTSLREARRIHRSGSGALSGAREAADEQWNELVWRDHAGTGRTARRGKRNRRTAQEYCVRGAGTVRAGDDERGATGGRENAVPEFVPGGRSGAELEGEWEDSGVGTGG